MHADEYQAYWALLTGKNPRDIYVPMALRKDAGGCGEEYTKAYGCAECGDAHTGKCQ